MKTLVILAILAVVAFSFTTVPVKKIQKTPFEQKLTIEYLKGTFNNKYVQKFLPMKLSTTWPEVKINNYMVTKTFLNKNPTKKINQKSL